MNLKNIILCPSRAGQLKKGVENFPYLIQKYIKPTFNIIDTNLKNNNKNNYVFSNSHKIYNACNSVDKFICIGGDHSITIGSGAASLNKYPNVKFIWIDAHADINTFDSSLTKNYHGMSLSFLTGLDKNKHFSFIKNLLNFKNIYYIGLRDIDSFEWKIINDHKIKYTLSEFINTNIIHETNKLSTFINKSPIHISFDVDSIDESFISSTGTIVRNGLDLKKTKFLLKSLLKNENVVGIDIVEMNMEINKNKYQTSIDNFLYLFSDIFKSK
tara:strand:+ start:41 stop:853 length:813 start_codon:yes stop_codon:yes gene_type:complete